MSDTIDLDSRKRVIISGPPNSLHALIQKDDMGTIQISPGESQSYSPDILKNHKASKHSTLLGHPRLASETPLKVFYLRAMMAHFQWRFAGGPMMTRFKWYLELLSLHKL